MIKLVQGKPQQVEIAVKNQGIPYTEEVSFGILEDGKVIFQESKVPEDGVVMFTIPPAKGGNYTYLLETDEGVIEKPMEVITPKLREITPKVQYAEVDLDETWDSNEDALIDTAADVYYKSKAKIKEIEGTLKDTKGETDAHIEGIVAEITEMVKPALSNLQQQVEQVDSKIDTVKEEHSILQQDHEQKINMLGAILESYDTKADIEVKMAGIREQINNKTQQVEGLALSATRDIQMLKADKTLDKFVKTYTKEKKKAEKEVDNLREATWKLGMRTVPPGFPTIKVAGQNNIDAGAPYDELTFVAGTGMTITTNRDTKKVTFASSGGGTVGPGTINELAYFDTTTSIASLAVATYPSLTELSYLKGTTSNIQTQLNAFVNGMIYKGNWDASAGTFPGGGVAQTGWFYTVSVAGTVNSVVFNIGDRLIAIANNASTTTYAANWTALDATDAVTSVFARTGNVVATAGDYTAALITNTPAGSIAAVTVQAAIDELDADKANVAGSLTQFVGNGNHKVFYSNGSGDITELSLGADGTYLKSNGASSAPSFATPVGTGDVIKVGTPVNNQLGVWTGDGTIEGTADIVYDSATKEFTLSLVQDNSAIYFYAANGAETSSSYLEFSTAEAVIDCPAFGLTTGASLFSITQGGTAALINVSGLSSTDKTFTFPNASGTIALTSDLSTYAPKASPTFTGTVILPKTIEIQDTSADHQYVLAVSELTADRTVTLPLLTASDEFVFKAHTQTLTNKRVTKRITSISSSGTPTINTDNCDCVTITALAAAITSMTTNLTGTPSDFDSLVFRIKDNGTARAITWGASFEAKGVALPTTTVLSKVLTVGFIWDAVTSKWGCVASAQEA